MAPNPSAAAWSPRRQGLARQPQPSENQSAALSVRRQALGNGPLLKGLKGWKIKPFSLFPLKISFSRRSAEGLKGFSRVVITYIIGGKSWGRGGGRFFRLGHVSLLSRDRLRFDNGKEKLFFCHCSRLALSLLRQDRLHLSSTKENPMAFLLYCIRFALSLSPKSFKTENQTFLHNEQRKSGCPAGHRFWRRRQR